MTCFSTWTKFKHFSCDEFGYFVVIQNQLHLESFRDYLHYYFIHTSTLTFKTNVGLFIDVWNVRLRNSMYYTIYYCILRSVSQLRVSHPLFSIYVVGMHTRSVLCAVGGLYLNKMYRKLVLLRDIDMKISKELLSIRLS